jgi:hypothetical protein
MGDFSRLDRFIREGEAQIKREKELEEATLQDYFDNRERQRLKKVNIMSMTDDEAYALDQMIKSDKERRIHNIKKGQAEDAYYNPQASNPHPVEMQKEIINVLSQCVEKASQTRPDLIPSFKKLAQLFSQSRLGQVSPSEGSNSPTEADYNSGVQKACVVRDIIKECTRAHDIKNFY